MPVTAADIARRLIILIAAGEWQAGEQLPGVEELTLSWKIPVETASDALYLLKTGGLAVGARPGEGIVVAPGGREIAERMVRDSGGS
jgi:DNA-binding transcriptional regulator YhcF (GntR family)